MKVRALAALQQLAGDAKTQRLERRVRQLPTGELSAWASTTVAGVGRAIDDWTVHGRPEGLDEARMATATLLVVLDELEARRVAAGQ